MTTQVKLGNIAVDVVLKDIKNVHLSVHPPTGRVCISAPTRMKPEAIRAFAISKLGWIRSRQRKFHAQERESPREYLERESHYVWGRRYLLEIIEREASPSVELRHDKLALQVRPGANETKRKDVLEKWYRNNLKETVPPLIEKWEASLGVSVAKFFVQRMKTKWGGCNHRARTIRLNTELAKKPRECLEYIVVHEMTHLREPTHNDRFVATMDQFMPNWRHRRESLNRLPVSHEDWLY